MSHREKLPSRRAGIRRSLECHIGGNLVKFEAQYNFFEDGRLAECFCRPFKTGAELEKLLDLFCIAISIALRHGAYITAIAKTMASDAPSETTNIFYAIVREGALLDPRIPPSDITVGAN